MSEAVQNEVMPMVKNPDSLSYKVSTSSSSKLRRVDVRPITNANIALAQNATTQSIIEIPQGCYNLSSSRLVISMQTAVQLGAGIAYGLFSHCPPIARLRVTTQNSGLVLIDISDFPAYWNATRCLDRLDKFIKRNAQSVSAVAATVADRVLQYHSSSSNSAVIDGGQVTNGRITNGGLFANLIQPPGGALCSQYVATTADNGAYDTVFSLNFEQLYGTIFAVDKVLPINDRLVVTVDYAGWANLGFQVQAAAVAALAAGPTTFSPVLELTQEVNPAIVSQLAEKARNGFDLLYPIINQSTQQIAATTTGSAAFSHSKLGHNLVCNLVTTMITDNGLALRANSYDYLGALITNHRSLLNSFPLDVQLLDHTTSADWREYSQYLASSSLNQTDYVSLFKSYIYWYGNNKDIAMCDLGSQAQGYNVATAQMPQLFINYTSAAVATRMVSNAIFQDTVKITDIGFARPDSVPVNHLALMDLPDRS